VEKLKLARWNTIPGERIEDTALRLWVHPDALVAAQQALREDRQKIGRAVPHVGSNTRIAAQRKFVELMFPKEIWGDWQAYCKLRQQAPRTILRSVVHTLLLSPQNPKWVGRGWWYHGRRWKLSGYTSEYRHKRWPCVTPTEITIGAYQALARRSAVLGCPPTALMRGGVIELLEGRMKQLQIVSQISEMWDDAARYVTGED
jgi:hypothetical protein